MLKDSETADKTLTKQSIKSPDEIENALIEFLDYKNSTSE